jgi:hypothetical protein
MRAFSEKQALSIIAEGVICNEDESDEVKGFLDQTLHTGQRLRQQTLTIARLTVYCTYVDQGLLRMYIYMPEKQTPCILHYTAGTKLQLILAKVI